MKAKKRLLGILLGLVLVLGLSLTAYAETQVSTADDFLAAVESSGEVWVTADFDLPLDSYLDFENAMTLDLNGHTITIIVTIEAGEDEDEVAMNCPWCLYAPLTIKDGSQEGGGKIIHPGFGIFIDQNIDGYGSLTLEGGMLEFTNIYTEGIDARRGPFTMTGGMINSVQYSI